MAFTVSSLVKGTVMGNKIMQALKVTADAATGTIPTALGQIEFYQISSVSAPTNPIVGMNAGVSGTSIAGTLALTNCTSGNAYMVTVYGH